MSVFDPYELETETANEFVIFVEVSLRHKDKSKLLRYLNKHYVGDVHCNKEENGRLVPKYPEKETEEFTNAVRGAHAHHQIAVKVIYDLNGRPRLELLN